MKYFLLSFWFLVLVTNSSSQNLIYNPSFEQSVNCPDDVGEINLADGWKNCSSQSDGTPDYYNPCANGITPYVGTPNNLFGFQPAHSGNSYAGIICYQTGAPQWRELIGTALQVPLNIGQKYYISFFANLSLHYSGLNSNTAIDKVGALFTTINYDETHFPSINNHCTISSVGFITDTLGWTKINGSFVADSAYQYFMIGNFFDDAHTNKIRYGGTPDSNAYYYIDDICVSTDSLYAYQWTGIKDLYQNDNISVYPNPFTSSLSITDLNAVALASIVIYNNIGQEVYHMQLKTRSYQYILDDLDYLKNGFYYIELNYRDNRTVLKKIIKN